MCGRFRFDDDIEYEEIRKILENMKKNRAKDSFKTGEIFPSDKAIILDMENNKPSLKSMYWGFPLNNKLIINARSETASKKPLFKNPLKTNRIVIISTGFYEWNKNKDKYLINRPDSPLLYMAGISRRCEIDNNIRECFTIFTRNASSSLIDIHDRMPIILEKNEIINWLTKDSYIEKAFNDEKDIIVEIEK